MNQLYIKITLIFSLLSISIGVFAASEAEYRKLNETYNLRADGSQEYRRYQELTLFTHTAMNGTYGETFITYNPIFQELKIHSSFTRQKDGTLVTTPTNAFIEVLPSNADGAPAYNHLKEMVIVHTGLELGATIVLDYSIISRPGYLPELDFCKQIQLSSPIKEYTLTCIVPDTKPVFYEVLGSKAQPAKISQGDITKLQWNFRNLPALSRAPETNLQNGDIPGLILTTYPSSQSAMQQLYQHFTHTPTTRITTLAQQLTAKSQTATEKLFAIHKYILQNLDLCSLSLSETGYRFRPDTTIITTAYGTEAEKINLLYALLNASGIKATPAAAFSLNQSPDHCGLSTIDQLIVLAEADGKLFRLNAYNTAIAATDSRFLFSLPTAELIPSNLPVAKIQYNATIQWDEQKANADIEADFSNYYLPYASSFADALLSVNDYTINQEQEHTIITGKQAVRLTPQQEYTLLTLPATYKGTAQTQSYARYNSKRSNNLLLPAPVEEKYTYTLHLPEYFTLCTPDQEKKISNAVGSLLISIKQTGQQINIERSLKINKKLITPADYPAFRALMTEWSDNNKQQLLLKK